MTFNPVLFGILVAVVVGLYFLYKHGKLNGIVEQLQSHLASLKPVVDAHVALVSSVAASQNPQPVAEVVAAAVAAPAPAPTASQSFRQHVANVVTAITGGVTSVPAPAQAAVIPGAQAGAAPNPTAATAIKPRVDPVMVSGSPGTVTLPVTGHVLSIPAPERGEMFPGYCSRVALQAAGNPALVGMLFLGVDQFFGTLGGYKADGTNWPEAADRVFNGPAYQTPAQRAATAAADASLTSQLK